MVRVCQFQLGALIALKGGVKLPKLLHNDTGPTRSDIVIEQPSLEVPAPA
jgi:hypothetical protein